MCLVTTGHVCVCGGCGNGGEAVPCGILVELEAKGKKKSVLLIFI